MIPVACIWLTASAAHDEIVIAKGGRLLGQRLADGICQAGKHSRRLLTGELIIGGKLVLAHAGDNAQCGHLFDIHIGSVAKLRPLSDCGTCGGFIQRNSQSAELGSGGCLGVFRLQGGGDNASGDGGIDLFCCPCGGGIRQCSRNSVIAKETHI